jgi:serine protease
MSALLLAPIGLHAPLMAQTVGAAPAQARVIVKFKADSTLLRRQALSATAASERATTLSARVGVPLTAGAAISERMQVLKASGIGSAELAQRLSAQSDVEYAVPDERRHRYAAPNDPRYSSVPLGSGGPVSGQWYLRAPTSTVRSSIDVEPAWDITTGSPSVVVAVLDTGVRFDHADLLAVGSGGNLLPGYDMIDEDSAGAFFTANDGNGRDADPSDPGDWVSSADIAGGNFNGCSQEGSSWHGTQTAGLIGALTNNALGMASVGRTVRVLPVRVLGKCGGYDSDIIAGMRWASGATDICRAFNGQGVCLEMIPVTTTPAKVINMSLGGGTSCSQAYRDVLTELTGLGVVVVASAGNSAGHAVSSPANCPGVIAVTGLRHAGTKVGFADVGTQVAIAAPGGNCVTTGATDPCLYPILTTTNAGTTTPVVASSIYSDGNNASVGTSFSAPLVAGTVGLMFSARPGMSVVDVRNALQASARPFPTIGADTGVIACRAPNGVDQLECYCTTTTCGAGMLDAGKAVAAANLGVQARITLNDDTPQPDQTIGLSAASSFALSPRTLSTYQWTLSDGGGIVTALTNVNGATASFTPTATGQITVSLTVTDSTGAQSTISRRIDVLAATTTTPPLINGGGDSGGGALGLAWLLGLAMGVVALQWQRHQRLRVRPVSTTVRRRPLHR